jgi:Cys-tRNA(Pro)/Cys-tRNA(Cys) deacylase
LASPVPKTNALRLLTSRKVSFQAFTFSDEVHSAEGAAQAMGVPVEQVYKTLVVLRERPHTRPLLVIVPGDGQIELRKLAAAVGEKKLRMAAQKEAESLTGLQVGGISALALLNKGFDIYIDSSAERWEQVYVSGGQRGLNIRLPVADLVRVTSAKWVKDVLE